MDIVKFVESLNTHINHYKKLDEEIAKEIADYVKKQAANFRIKISYEHPSVISKIHKHNDSLEKDQPLKPVRFKMVLATNKHKSDFSKLLVRQCNGVILAVEELAEKVECRILAVPSHEFNPKFNNTSILNFIVAGHYKVFQVQDGTTLNLYYDNKWIFSSKNCINVNNLVWRGFSYKDILEDILKQYPDFSYDKLDTNKTYTIGIKHPAHHPFNQPMEWLDEDFTENRATWIKKAWVIQSYNLTTGDVSLTENIGLPVQQPVEEIKQIPILFKKLNDSLRDYVDASRKMEPKNEDKLKNCRDDMFLGVILRSVNPEKTECHSDILLESSLWKEIRNLVYQLPYIQNKLVREKQEQNFKNMNFVILSSYVNFAKKMPFIIVFPQFKHYYEKYDRVINAAVEKIHEDMNNKVKKIKKKEEGDQQIVAVNTDDVITDKIYNAFIDIVKNNYQLTEKNVKNIDRKNIRSIITHLKYLDLLYKLI